MLDYYSQRTKLTLCSFAAHGEVSVTVGEASVEVGVGESAELTCATR